MAVYTALTHNAIAALLDRYDIGTLTAFTGIESGVENTNYFIDLLANDTGQQRYVLTLFEYLPADTLPFFTDLTQMLADHGLPVPSPIRDRDGVALQSVKGKSCLIQRYLSGSPKPKRNLTQCAAVGRMLAQLHCAGLGSSLSQANQRGMSWLEEQTQRMVPLMAPSQGPLLARYWRDIATALLPVAEALPWGLIHGDLFYDNVLFVNDEITGVIDFYNACSDWLAYDVAVTVNDWCQDHDTHRLDQEKIRHFLDAYQALRPFSETERAAWPSLLKLAAFRFWVSRLYTFVYPPDKNEATLITAKNPDDFFRLLSHIDAHEAALAL